MRAMFPEPFSIPRDSRHMFMKVPDYREIRTHPTSTLRGQMVNAPSPENSCRHFHESPQTYNSVLCSSVVLICWLPAVAKYALSQAAPTRSHPARHKHRYNLSPEGQTAQTSNTGTRCLHPPKPVALDSISHTRRSCL